MKTTSTSSADRKPRATPNTVNGVGRNGVNETVQLWLPRIKGCIKHVTLLSHPYLIPYAVVNTLSAVVYNGWNTFLIPRAFEKGVSLENVLILTGVLTFVNIVGRIFAGSVVSRCCSPIKLFLVLMSSCVIISLVDVFIWNFTDFLICAILESFAMEGMICLTFIAARERTPSTFFPTMFGVFEFWYGLGYVLGDAVSGKE